MLAGAVQEEQARPGQLAAVDGREPAQAEVQRALAVGVRRRPLQVELRARARRDDAAAARRDERRGQLEAGAQPGRGWRATSA